jgi:hypothetical protein
MLTSKLTRTATTALVIGALGIASVAGPASARDRHHNDAGAAVALGIGALVIGGILASQARRDRDRLENRHYRPEHRSYGHDNDGRRHYERRHRGPNHERFND